MSPMMQRQLQASEAAADEMWHLIAGILVFFMQSGFAMLEAGSVGSKNTLNILFKNICDACFAAIGFWLIGYGVAYGDANNGFIGTTKYGLADDGFYDENSGYHSWFFQFTFAATAATIVSGSVAERCKLDAYFIYSIVLTVFIYPVVVCWCWGGGFLSPFKEDDSKSINYIDFAGSGVVHMVGGFAGLVAAIIIEPREGRFVDGQPKKLHGHNLTLACLGILILWVGWYGFNAGSTLCAGSTGCSQLASKIATVTTISAASSALTIVFYQKFMKKPHDLIEVGAGVLAGLVSITAPCAVVEVWASCLIGIIGAIVYLLSAKLLIKLQIDDPLEASPIHGFCGIWGVLAVGIFGTDSNAAFAGYDLTGDPFKSGQQFGVQVIGALCILGWTVVTSTILFLGIKYTIGLRVDKETELEGLDSSEHGGGAYNITATSDKI